MLARPRLCRARLARRWTAWRKAPRFRNGSARRSSKPIFATSARSSPMSLRSIRLIFAPVTPRSIRLQQTTYVGDYARRRERVKLGLGLRLRRTESAVLHVDDEKCGAAFHNRLVACEGLSWHNHAFPASQRSQQVPAGLVLGFGGDQDR